MLLNWHEIVSFLWQQRDYRFGSARFFPHGLYISKRWRKYPKLLMYVDLVYKKAMCFCYRNICVIYFSTLYRSTYLLTIYHWFLLMHNIAFYQLFTNAKVCIYTKFTLISSCWLCVENLKKNLSFFHMISFVVIQTANRCKFPGIVRQGAPF
jgi:hypothetical protein